MCLLAYAKFIQSRNMGWRFIVSFLFLVFLASYHAVLIPRAILSTTRARGSLKKQADNFSDEKDYPKILK